MNELVPKLVKDLLNCTEREESWYTTCHHVMFTVVPPSTHSEQKVMAFINEAKLERLWLCVRTQLYTSHLCCLDVTVHLVVQLAHLELQQRERGDMSFRNKACSEATAEVPD